MFVAVGYCLQAVNFTGQTVGVNKKFKLEIESEMCYITFPVK